MEPNYSSPGSDEQGQSSSTSANIEPEEVETIWRENRRWMASVILAHMPRDAELDDLLQEVAMLVVRSIHTVQDRRALRPWLRTVAVNAARSAGRKRKARLRLFKPVEEGSEVVANQPADPDGIESEREKARQRGQQLLEATYELPAMYRETILLRCVQGLSQRRAAEILGLPETTIETRLVRARRMLKEQMQRRIDQEHGAE